MAEQTRPTAQIFSIKRLAVHDGPGIRTTVFFKGCPLKCLWCHNPEGIGPRPQLAYRRDKCVHCGECASLCPTGAHQMENGLHQFRRDLCIGCGKCAENCLGDALTFYGRKVTVEQLLPLILEDRDFYETSGGGVTLSGGECLIQGEFCLALLKRLKAEGIHTAVDTCGCVPRETLRQVLPYTDIFLYDIKAMDEDVHLRCTGRSNRLILDNLRFLDAMGCALEVRIPLVPGYNDNQMEKIAAFLKPLKQVRAVRVLPYHNYAESKYEALSMENTLPPTLPTPEQLRAAQALFKTVQ